MARKKKEIIIDDEQEKEITEIIVEKNGGFSLLEVIIVMIITAIGGILIGTVVTNTGFLFGESQQDLNEFIGTYNELIDTYYEELNTEELIDSAIEGMIGYLNDPNSTYITSSNTEAFEEQVNGSYTGAGMEIYQENGQVIVNSIFANSSAEEEGIKAGDIILEVDNQTVVGLTNDEIASIIKGEEGTSVTVKYLSKETNEERIVSLTRKEIDLPSVYSNITEINDQKIGELSITMFAENTLEQFEEELVKLEEDDIDSLIIDVRGNPGGNLDIVLEIASLFLEKEDIVYQLDTKGEIEKITSTNNEKRDYEIVVIQDGSSASASEILAASLKESYGARVVGTNSYGKGTVQQAFTLSSGATVKYTIQKWLTPDGNDIDGIGVEPTDFMELSSAYYQNPIEENDTQLQKAREILTD